MCECMFERERERGRSERLSDRIVRSAAAALDEIDTRIREKKYFKYSWKKLRQKHHILNIIMLLLSLKQLNIVHFSDKYRLWGMLVRRINMTIRFLCCRIDRLISARCMGLHASLITTSLLPVVVGATPRERGRCNRTARARSCGLNRLGRARAQVKQTRALNFLFNLRWKRS